MSTTLTVVFDGRALHPEIELDLKPNARYIITIESEAPPVREGDAWDVLEEMIGTVDAPEDWALEHDHYLYGTPKRYSNNNQ